MAVRLYYNAADARAHASDAWHDEWISKSGLKARFWTDKAISQFLGLPQKAGPILAWKQKDVGVPMSFNSGWQSGASG